MKIGLAAQGAVILAAATAAAASAAAVMKLLGTGAQATDEAFKLLGECVQAQLKLRAVVFMVRVDVARERRSLGDDLIDGMLAVVVIMFLTWESWFSIHRAAASHLFQTSSLNVL